MGFADFQPLTAGSLYQAAGSQGSLNFYPFIFYRQKNQSRRIFTTGLFK